MTVIVIVKVFRDNYWHAIQWVALYIGWIIFWKVRGLYKSL